MLESNIHVQLEQFDGPMALLLHLIQKEEMKIRELNINLITHQYLDYLKKMQEVNFNIAGDYLLLASTLLYWKSKNSLEEEDGEALLESLGGEGVALSREELIRRLEELDRCQKLGQKLWALDKKGHDVFTKPKINRRTIINSFLTPVELNKLTESMVDFLKREKRRYFVVKRDKISIKEKLLSLRSVLQLGTQTTLSGLVTEKESKEESVYDMVVTFISLLELARLKKINIFQNEDRGDIYIKVVDNLQDFNVELADGFGEEEEEEVAETIIDDKGSVDLEEDSLDVQQ